MKRETTTIVMRAQEVTWKVKISTPLTSKVIQRKIKIKTEKVNQRRRISLEILQNRVGPSALCLVVGLEVVVLIPRLAVARAPTVFLVSLSLA